MADLGGLLFRTEVDSDRSQFVMIPRMLRELVPADQLKSMSSEEWKKVKDGIYRGRRGCMKIPLLKMEKTVFYMNVSMLSEVHCVFLSLLVVLLAAHHLCL